MQAFLDGLCMAVGFLTMWRERALPIPLTADDWQPDPQRTWFHLRKDRFCARLDKDKQWWGKFLCFSVAALAITVCVQLTVQ